MIWGENPLFLETPICTPSDPPDFKPSNFPQLPTQRLPVKAFDEVDEAGLLQVGRNSDFMGI